MPITPEWRAWRDSLSKPDVTMPLSEWTRYRDILRRMSDAAADEFRDAVFNVNGHFKGVGLGLIPRNELIDYAYALVTKYSEGAAEAACEFYDALAAISGADVPPAVPAETPSYNQVGKTLNGVMKASENESLIANSLGRLVKQTGQDTTLQNAIRDGAEVAWVPSGDTCAFCIALASRGWEEASSDLVKNGHAEHIHANCDCAYAVRFNKKFNVEGYDPKEYLDMYNATRGTPQQKINAMRRMFYEENSEEINAQKRSAYAKQRERESTWAEETKANT